MHACYLAGDYPHGDVAELGGGHVELPAAEMGNLEELSKVRKAAAQQLQVVAAATPRQLQCCFGHPEVVDECVLAAAGRCRFSTQCWSSVSSCACSCEPHAVGRFVAHA